MTKASDFISIFDDESLLAAALDHAGIESEQDWDNEITTWLFDDGSHITIQGPHVFVA